MTLDYINALDIIVLVVFLLSLIGVLLFFRYSIELKAHMGERLMGICNLLLFLLSIGTLLTLSVRILSIL